MINSTTIALSILLMSLSYPQELQVGEEYLRKHQLAKMRPVKLRLDFQIWDFLQSQDINPFHYLEGSKSWKVFYSFEGLQFFDQGIFKELPYSDVPLEIN